MVYTVLKEHVFFLAPDVIGFMLILPKMTRAYMRRICSYLKQESRRGMHNTYYKYTDISAIVNKCIDLEKNTHIYNYI